MKKELAIYGAGGFGREVACLINRINKKTPLWNLIGFFDDGLAIGHKNEYGSVLGGISVLNSYSHELSVVIAIGNPKILHAVLSKISNPNIKFPNLIAPDITFADENNLSLGKGNIIGVHCCISCNVHLQDFNLLNTDVFFGHDVFIGSCNVFNPSTRISGEVNIGNNNLFGVNSTVLQQKKIGSYTTIGANSVIIKNTKDNTTYIGNPAIEFKF